MARTWKKGRGKLGFMQPLLGQWEATAETPMGPINCVRTIEEILGGSYMRLNARWKLEKAAKPAEHSDESGTELKGGYEELAIIGAGENGKVTFWSFTSDGKRSQGTVADVTDVHKDAVGFEAQMPAGLARMVYWPDDEDGFFWAVESKNAKGWRRFTLHHYHPMAASGRPSTAKAGGKTAKV